MLVRQIFKLNNQVKKSKNRVLSRFSMPSNLNFKFKVHLKLALSRICYFERFGRWCSNLLNAHGFEFGGKLQGADAKLHHHEYFSK